MTEVWDSSIRATVANGAPYERIDAENAGFDEGMIVWRVTNCQNQAPHTLAVNGRYLLKDGDGRPMLSVKCRQTGITALFEEV